MKSWSNSTRAGHAAIPDSRRPDIRIGRHRWTANLRLLEIDAIKTVPHVPLSHPFVERLIGTMRRECLDHVLCWNAGDLERKLVAEDGIDRFMGDGGSV